MITLECQTVAAALWLQHHYSQDGDELVSSSGSYTWAPDGWGVCALNTLFSTSFHADVIREVMTQTTLTDRRFGSAGGDFLTFKSFFCLLLLGDDVQREENDNTFKIKANVLSLVCTFYSVCIRHTTCFMSGVYLGSTVGSLSTGLLNHPHLSLIFHVAPALLIALPVCLCSSLHVHRSPAASLPGFYLAMLTCSFADSSPRILVWFSKANALVRILLPGVAVRTQDMLAGYMFFILL